MFSDMMRATAQRHSDRPAVVFGDARLTHGEVYERACRLANLLREHGVKPGEGVASLGRNRLSSIEELGAVALGGFVRSPLYLQDAPQRQAFMLQRVRSAALIVDAACWPPLAEALGAEGRAALKLIHVSDRGPEALAPASDEGSAPARGPTQAPRAAADPDRPPAPR
ncbi:MAG: acyl--CoA ligase, partial [Sphingopyxis sp.]|nr:acyl--CoA ligase [Sphingopyxis sp.]